MSLGFSVGDFIAVGQLAWQVYKSCREAPESFKNISQEVLSMHAVLKEVEETLLGQPLSRSQEARLKTVTNGCQDVLQDLQSLLLKYESLGSKTKRTCDRLRWYMDDIAELRARLTSNIVLLNAYISTSQVIVERQLNKFVQEFKDGKHEPSDITTQTIESLSMDEKQTWRTIRKELEDIGMSVAAFDANKDFILGWFKEAIMNGAFEELTLEGDSSSKSHKHDSHHSLKDSYVAHAIASSIEVFTEAQLGSQIVLSSNYKPKKSVNAVVPASSARVALLANKEKGHATTPLGPLHLAFNLEQPITMTSLISDADEEDPTHQTDLLQPPNAELEERVSGQSLSVPECYDNDLDLHSSSSDVSDWETSEVSGELHHPLYHEYLSRLGDADLCREAHSELVSGYEKLLHAQQIRQRVGLELQLEDQTILGDFPVEETKLLEELRQIEADIERLKLECTREGILVEAKQEDDETYILNPLGYPVHEHDSFPLLLQRPDEAEDQEAPKSLLLDFEDTGDRITRWLLDKLRSSRLEVELLARFSEGLGPTINIEKWQEEVLDFWFIDSANSPSFAYEEQPTLTPSPSSPLTDLDKVSSTCLSDTQIIQIVIRSSSLSQRLESRLWSILAKTKEKSKRKGKFAETV